MSELDFENLDLLDPALHSGEDRWKVYTYLREEAPLYWDKKNELWAISRHADIIKMSSDPVTWTNGESALPNLPPDPSMIHQYPEQHTRQRRLVSSAFTPSRMRKLEPRVREICIELIEELTPKGACDLVHDFARLMPLRIIGEMLGHPPEDLEQFGEWIDQMTYGGSGPDYVDDAVNDAFGEFCEYHEAAMEKREAERTDDFLSVWLDAEIDGEKLDEGQLLFEHALIAVGGSETTRNVMSTGMLMLIEHPEQRQYLLDNIEDEEVLKAAVEEMIRWAVPFTRMCRTATKDVEWEGTTIKEGQQVMMMYPAALRDPRAIERPDEFDLRRPFSTQNLAFGHGRHLCLGANLARMELRIFFYEVLKRMPQMRLDPDKTIERRKSSFTRGFSKLPVRWD